MNVQFPDYLHRVHMPSYHRPGFWGAAMLLVASLGIMLVAHKLPDPPKRKLSFLGETSPASPDPEEK